MQRCDPIHHYSIYTGLDYAHNRYYASTLGRFTTPDPSWSADLAHPQSWNQYAYVEGDPINKNDPSGLLYTLVCDDKGNCTLVIDVSSLLWPGSGGGGGTDSQPTHRRRQKTPEEKAKEQQDRIFNRAVKDAIDALLKSKCASIFHLPDNMSPVTLLDDLVRGARGSVDYGDLGAAEQKDGKWTGISATTVGVPPYTNGKFAGAAITLNSNPEGTFFKPRGYLGLGISDNQTVTVIHELGHAANRIFGKGSSDIKEDSKSQDNYDNSKLVKDECI